MLFDTHRATVVACHSVNVAVVLGTVVVVLLTEPPALFTTKVLARLVEGGDASTILARCADCGGSASWHTTIEGPYWYKACALLASPNLYV
jgi:hypothetical protein